MRHKVEKRKKRENYVLLSALTEEGEGVGINWGVGKFFKT